MSDVSSTTTGASGLSAVSAGRGRTFGATQLRIAAPAIIVQTVLAPALPRFLAQNPDIGVRLVNEESGSNAPDAFDATIRIGTRDAMPGVHGQQVAKLRDVVCASPEFIAEYGEPHSPAELNLEHCIGIVDEANELEDWLFGNESRQIVLKPGGPLVFGDPQSAAAAAVHGGGFVRVLALAVESQIAAGLLRRVLDEWSGRHQDVWITYPGALTGPLERFASFVGGVLPTYSSNAK